MQTIFGITPRAVIDNATIWTETLHCDGRRYEYRYSAYDKDLLTKYAAERRTAIDYMRSPMLSQPRMQSDGLWTITLTYYGLD